MLRPTLTMASGIEGYTRKDSVRRRPIPSKSVIVGREIVRPTLRSDLAGIALREGDDLLTFEGFSTAYKRGLLKGSDDNFWNYSGDKWGNDIRINLEDAANDRNEYRKWRETMGLPPFNDPPSDNEGKIKYYKELREILRKNIDKEKWKGENIVESISFGSTLRDDAKSKLEKRIGEMSRAQQRKKGRVIVDGKTGPQRTTEGRIKEEDVWKSNWRRYEYKADEKLEPYHIPEPSGKITYKVPVNIPKEYTDYYKTRKDAKEARDRFDVAKMGLEDYEKYRKKIAKLDPTKAQAGLSDDPTTELRLRYIRKPAPYDIGGHYSSLERDKKKAGVSGKTDDEVIENLFPFISPEERKRLIRIRRDMGDNYKVMKTHTPLSYGAEQRLEEDAVKKTTFKTEEKRFNSKKELEDELRWIRKNVKSGLKGQIDSFSMSKDHIKKAVEFDDPKWKKFFLKKYSSYEEPYMYAYGGDRPSGYSGTIEPIFTKDEKLESRLRKTLVFPEGGSSKLSEVNGAKLVSIDSDVPLKRGAVKGKRKYLPVKLNRTTIFKEGRFRPAKDYYELGGGRYVLMGKPQMIKEKRRTPYTYYKKKSAMRNPDFTMAVAKGGGRRVFHLEEAGEKGWKKVGVDRYAKQAENWKALDTDSTPQSTLRGLRDRRTYGARLIGRGVNPRQLDRSKEYKSARNEALIQMRINETAGVRDAKAKAEKEIKDIRVSEAQKALNLKLAKETAEKTTEGLKAKNAGLVHSYNVNVRNQTAATLLGSNPDELNLLLKKGGGLALIKEMIRKGEIADVSTIGQLNVSKKQKDGLLRLYNEGGDFIEGKEYFFRDLDDFGRTITRRGYLNKGGERKDNLELMYLKTNEDGSVSKERFIVPKGNVLKADDYTSTTASGKQQRPEGAQQLTQFELDVFGDSPPQQPQTEVKEFEVQQDPKTGVKSLVKIKGAGIADPSPKPQQSIFGTTGFDSMGGDLELQLDESSEGASSEENFEFGGDAPTEPAPEPSTTFSMYGPSPKIQKLAGEIDELLDDFQLGGAEDIADTLGEGMPNRPATDEIQQQLEQSLLEVDEDGELTGVGETSPQLLEALAEAEAQSPSPTDTTLDQLVLEGKVPATSKKPKVAFEDKPLIEQLPPKSPKDLAKGLFDNNTEVPEELRGWSGTTELPETLFKEDVDMSKASSRRRALEPLVEGQTMLWSTKYGDKSRQRVLIIDQQRADVIFKGLRGVSIVNDKGNSQKLSDKQLRGMYKKISENIANGKRETAFNDKQLLRALEMIDLYEEAEP